jgi:flagella basal body P-ring formation protein FlgA
LAAAWTPSFAAELRLRSQCSPHGPVVTLGDVTDILTADEKQAGRLAAVELFPAPAATRQRILQVRELQDLLLMRGVNLAEHQFSGSSQVVVGTTGEPVHKEHDQPLPPLTAKRAQKRVQEALVQYLQSKTGAAHSFLLQFELPPALARAAAATIKPIVVSGGTPPWTDKQSFDLAIETPEAAIRSTVDVQVGEPSVVVAVAHSLARGAIIHENDVTLVHLETTEGGGNNVHSIDEVIGKQVNRAMADGKILTSDAVQSPLLVHRGDVVTVFARTAGITVRTTARALDDGSLGDLVTLETMQERKPYQARVSGVRETEVFAQAISAEKK